MKFNILLLGLSILFLVSCDNQSEQPTSSNSENSKAVTNLDLDIEQAKRLASLPMKCIEQEYPNKTHAIYANAEDIKTPKEYHPAFYGCFDWHSAVHGHWSLVRILKSFDEINTDENGYLAKLQTTLTADNIQTEIDYFSMNAFSQSYERTYGWAWLLKLAEELYTWDTPEAQQLYQNLKPLADLIADKYIEYLPKLNYPIRVGEHSNTAFGLTFAYDYAAAINDTELKSLIEKRAKEFYLTDANCPISWEPSGYDFLSPCLEEADLMRRILSEAEFTVWFDAFLPTLDIEPAKVSDRTDGKLVHLDGLNFSRAWCLYGIANQYPKYDNLKKIADEHIAFSLPNIVDGDYAGEHWLASFALFALDQKQ